MVTNGADRAEGPPTRAACARDCSNDGRGRFWRRGAIRRQRGSGSQRRHPSVETRLRRSHPGGLRPGAAAHCEDGLAAGRHQEPSLGTLAVWVPSRSPQDAPPAHRPVRRHDAVVDVGSQGASKAASRAGGRERFHGAVYRNASLLRPCCSRSLGPRRGVCVLHQPAPHYPSAGAPGSQGGAGAGRGRGARLVERHAHRRCLGGLQPELEPPHLAGRPGGVDHLRRVGSWRS